MSKCFAQLGGVSLPIKMYPGQQITLTGLTFTISNVTDCNCGNSIIDITVGTDTDLTVWLSNLPSLPLSGYCGTPQTFDATIQLSPSAIPGLTYTAVITFDQQSTPPASDAVLYIPIEVQRIYDQPINLGQICNGAIEIPICNRSDDSVDFTLSSCSCPEFSEASPGDWSVTVSDCDCDAFQTDYAQSEFGQMQCYVNVSTDFGYSERVLVIWDSVPCELSTLSWSIEDDSNTISIDDTDTPPIVLNTATMGQRLTLTWELDNDSGLTTGKRIYFTPWLFGRSQNWQYQFPGLPGAGFEYEVPDGSSPDGTFSMQWYGAASQQNGECELVISATGKQLEFTYTFHLLADAIREPGFIPYENHDWALKNAVDNLSILDNTTYDSAYNTDRYANFMASTFDPVSEIYQRRPLSIPSRLPWYDDNSVKTNIQVSDVVFSLFSENSFTNPTAYASTVRKTWVECTFNAATSSPAGTPPSSTWVYAIRAEKADNSVPILENYEISYLDTSQASGSGILGSMITPVTYSGSGDEFYFRFEIDQTEFESDEYRLILVNTFSTDMGSRSHITNVIQSIKIDDTPFDLTGLNTTLATTVQESTSDALIGLPVNTAVEAKLVWDTDLANAEFQSRSGTGESLIDSISEVQLRIFRRDSSPEGIVFTRYFYPTIQRRCGINYDASAAQGLPGFVDNSDGTVLDLRFPFSIPDNQLRLTTRANWFTSGDEGELQWQPYNRAGEPCFDPPSYSWADQDIYLQWVIRINMNDNEAIYAKTKALYAIKPAIEAQPDIDFSDLVIEEYTGEDSNTDVIDKPCGDSGILRISADLPGPFDFYGIAVEAQPTNNDRVSEATGPSSFIVPVESDLISNLVIAGSMPPYRIGFDFDFPAWRQLGPETNPGSTESDKQFNIHLIIK